VSMARALAPMVSEDEARAESMSRAQEIAEIDRLRGAFDANGEIAAGSCRLGFHGSFMP
jgi:hypothetical protein